MGGMRRPDGRATIVLGLVALLIVLPALYVLSIGPAVGMYARGWLHGEAYFTVYWPIIEIVHKPERESLQDLLNSYCELFLPVPQPHS